MTDAAGGRRGQLRASGLRPGWTTGACATAAATAAWEALHTGEFPDPVQIVLPKGHEPAFALTQEELGQLAGLSRQTVNRVLRSLEAAGIVTLDFGRVAIVDDAALSAHLAATASS